MEEIWKDIEGYEGLYQVSNFGNVKRLEGKIYSYITNKYETRKEHMIKTRVGNRKYKVVNLCKNSKRECKTVHRLIAQAFLPNPNNFECVNHIDGNKLNNKIDNLEWCTTQQNIQHAYKNNLMTNNKKIDQYSLDNKFIKTFNSINEASKKIGVAQPNISMCAIGKKKTAGGYIWKYTK